MGGFYGPPIQGATQLNPPPDPLAQFEKITRLRAMMQQQQLQQQLGQQAIQRGGLENQQLGMQVADQQKLRQIVSQYDNWDDIISNASKAGVSPQALMGLQMQRMELRQKSITADEGQHKLDQEHGDWVVGQVDNLKKLPPEQRQALLPALQQQHATLFPKYAAQFPTQIPTDDTTLDAYANLFKAHSQEVSDVKSQAEAREKNALAAKTEAETAFYKGMGLAPGVSPETAGYAAFLQKGGKPEGWPAFKAGSEAAARQPYQLQEAAAREQTAQLIKGISEPVYVFNNAGGARQLMSKTDAIKAGYRTMLPVTEKQVGEDIQLNNRLADVENKIGRYQQSFAADLSLADKNAIAQLIGEDRFKAGLWGTTLPVDFLNKANEAYLHGKLSKQAADRLIAYFNANESLIGYNRVLSGSARSNEKQLELQSRTLPSPMDAPAYGNNALSQFKENLDYAGQGLPQLPGIKTHQQVRADLQAETAQRGQQRNVAGGLQVGQSVKLKNGKTVTVTAVHSDGSFDAR